MNMVHLVKVVGWGVVLGAPRHMTGDHHRCYGQNSLYKAQQPFMQHVRRLLGRTHERGDIKVNYRDSEQKYLSASADWAASRAIGIPEFRRVGLSSRRSKRRCVHRKGLLVEGRKGLITKDCAQLKALVLHRELRPPRKSRDRRILTDIHQCRLPLEIGANTMSFTNHLQGVQESSCLFRFSVKRVWLA